VIASSLARSRGLETPDHSTVPYPNHKMGEDDYETKSGKGHDDDKGTFREHVV